MSPSGAATATLTPASPLPSAKQLLADPRLLLALGFGSGLAPKAPGTVGTLAALPLAWLMQLYLPMWGYGLAILLAGLAGIYLCGYAGRWLGVSDHGAIVWDEFVGLWIALLWVPAGWVWWLYGFVLFRVFDIWKPWPIGWADRQVKGGLGVMLDDILAGAMALAVLQASWWLWPL